MLITDIEPLKAMEIFYEGEESGVWEGEFIKNEKKRELFFPPKLKEYLQRFGFLSVNRGRGGFWFPDHVRTAAVPYEGISRDMLILGTLNGGDDKGFYIGIFADECGTDNPPVIFGELIETEDGGQALSFWESGMFLKDALVCLFIENLFIHTNGTDYDEDGIEALLKKYPAELCEGEKSLKQLIDSSQRPCRYICYDNEENRFYCFDVWEDGVGAESFSPCISTEELESCFSREFYENSMNCDFAHALRLMEKIINRLEDQEETEPLNLGEKYRLAGRCCWALKQWDRAEEWLKKAESVFTSESAPAQAAQSFYQGLGNFYSDMGDEEKSKAAYREADRLAEASGEDLCRLMGDRLLRKGIELADSGFLEEAIEYFEKALNEYKKNPKECKYDIARCGQLKGDTRHRLKEIKKQTSQ